MSQNLGLRDAAALDALRTARSEIEGRFLAGGAALMTVLDIVQRLLGALDGVASAMQAGVGDDADVLVQTKDRLLALPLAERARQQRMVRLLRETSEIIEVMRAMSDTLSRVRICALMTRITGASMPEFAGFADDMLGSSRLAETQILFFAERLARLRANLVAARNETDRTLTSTETVAPELSKVLQHSVDGLRVRKTELAALAARVTVLAKDVETKVAVVLSSLQIGDITRQRIEHVEAGLTLIATLLDCEAPDDGAVFRNTAANLLVAHLKDLSAEFDAGATRIVTTLAEIGRSAQAILAARPVSAGDGAGSLGELDLKIGDAQQVVAVIDQARIRTAEIGAAANDTAGELLGNVGSIGNIRDVKDDMRRLAINAYIKCSRVGERARPVASVAMELQDLAVRLGALTDQVLTAVGKLRDSGASMEDGEAEAPLGEAIDSVAAGVRAARGRMDANLAEMDALGAAVAENVDATVNALEFESSLGEALSRATSNLADSIDRDAWSGAAPCDRLRAFSDELLRLYTMASEREIHRRVLPWAAQIAPPTAPADDLLEDALF